MSDDSQIALENWVSLERPRAIVAIDLSIQFLQDGKVDAALAILEVLGTRLAVDEGVEEYFFQCEKLEGGKYFEVCQ